MWSAFAGLFHDLQVLHGVGRRDVLPRVDIFRCASSLSWALLQQTHEMWPKLGWCGQHQLQVSV